MCLTKELYLCCRKQEQDIGMFRDCISLSWRKNTMESREGRGQELLTAEHFQLEEKISVTTANVPSERCWRVLFRFTELMWFIELFFHPPPKRLCLFKYIFYFIAHSWRCFTQWGTGNIMQFPQISPWKLKKCLSVLIFLDRPSKNWT